MSIERGTAHEVLTSTIRRTFDIPLIEYRHLSMYELAEKYGFVHGTQVVDQGQTVQITAIVKETK